jgi:hypothetical protein
MSKARKQKVVQEEVLSIRDLTCQTDCVLREMLRVGADLTLESYLDFAFLPGDDIEGIEEDAEFLASVPDVILRGPTRVQ